MKPKNKTLLIDCGNTYLKWCLLGGDNLTNPLSSSLTRQESLLHKDSSVLEVYKTLIEEQSAKCDSVVMTSVLGEVFSAGASIIAEDNGLDFLEASSESQLATITNGYKNPGNLGTDRLVAMIGAYELIDDSQACIVVDSGTATTIDAVDNTGKHLGGVIFPGLELSLRSLSDNTELLPSLDVTELGFEKNGLATDTPEAITSGCLLSLASSIDGICNKMERQLQTASKETSFEVKRILCGGAATVLLPHLENDYEHHDNLIMLGLKKIKESASQ